jgi:hypothetical protein
LNSAPPAYSGRRAHYLLIYGSLCPWHFAAARLSGHVERAASQRMTLRREIEQKGIAVFFPLSASMIAFVSRR